MKWTILLAAIVTSASFAKDPFSCVDPDFAEAFLGNSPYGRALHSTSIPDTFPVFDVPGGFELVGSKTINSSSTVVYRTRMGAQSALDGATKTMNRDGWAQSSTQQHRRRGFSARSTPSSALLCREGNTDAVSIYAADKGGQAFVSFMQHDGTQSCGAPAPASPHHDPSTMMRLLPDLELPEGVTATGTGMGGSGHEVSSRVDLSGASSRPDLISHFEDQIQQQGWEYQTNWSSRLSSGSVWMLDSAEEGVLIGTLHVFDTGADPVRLRFSVTPADSSKGSNGGSWSGSSN